MSTFDEIKKKRKKLEEQSNVQGNKTFNEIKSYQQDVAEGREIIPVKIKRAAKQQPKETTWFDKGAFDDGYDFGDISKSILGTAVKTGQNFVKGVQSNAEGLMDFGTNVLSMGTEKLGWDSATKKLRDFAQQDFIANNDLVNKTIINTNPILSAVNRFTSTKDRLEDGYSFGDLFLKNNQIDTLFGEQESLSEKIDEIASNTLTGEKLDALTQTVGQIAGQGALSQTAIPWQVTAFTNSAGNEMNNAFQNNASSGQAFMSGLISGLVEVGTEYIGGGANKILGMESLGSKALGKLGSKISNKVVSRLAKIGIDASSEGLEEVLSGLGTAIGQKLTYMNDKELKELYSKDQALEDFVMGALGTIITNVPGQVQSIKRGENAFSGLTDNEQKVLDKVIEERTNEAKKGNKELTKQQIKEIEKQAREDLQNGYISTDTIEKTLGEEYNADKDLILNEAYREQGRRRNAFNTDLNQYKDENQRKIVQKAIDSGILNDSKKTHNFVDLVSKIAADKGMDFDFTNNQRIQESGFGVEGKTVNGYVNGNTIGLNIESNNALNKTVGHEITHVLEGSELYQALQDSLKSYVGEDTWNKRIKELSETYKNVENADVTKELTADLVGENLFNNEDFVRSLSTKNRNLFEKIYDEIKYLVKIATAGSKEKRDLTKLQKVFQEAYRDSKTTKEGTQYSIQGLENYSEQEIKDISNDYIKNILTENGIDDVEIVDSAIHGSRGRGTARADSDLDLVVQYKGDIREDDLFNALNDNGEDNLYIDGIRVDINPIQEDLSSYMERSNQYDEEIKKNTKYSLSDNGEMVDQDGNKVTLEASEEGNSGTLMVLHNLGESKFNGVLDLGGIPVPSIAITNPNIIDHNQFGEGTLIFDKSTIDPSIEANEVYDRDVWSPTIRDNIQIDYEINDDAIERTAEKLGIEAWRLRDAVEDNNPEYLVERLLREEKLIDKYVADNNIKYETAYKDAETSVDMHQSGENLRQFIRDNDLTVEKLCKDNNLKQKYFDEIKKYYDESSFPQAVKENLYKEKIDYLNNWIDSQHGMDINSIDDIPRGLRKYQRDFDLIKSGDNKVIDEWQTEKNKKQAAIDNGIEDYLKKQTKDVYGEKGIRNDVELFTNSGSRRSFWALHDEYNLDNLVEALTKGETTGTQHWGSGYGQIQATMANRFNSISDIKANEGLLTNLSENNEALENAKANIDSDIEKIEANNDVYYDTVAELLVDFARGDLTIDNFRKLTRNDYQTVRNVSDSLIEKIIDDMNSLKNLPTDYFEAKPQRAVGLDEIQMAVIPNNWSQETKQRLIDKGIKYTEYDPSIEGDRQRVINQFEDLKFSLSNQNDIAPTQGWNVRGEDIRLQNAIAPLQEQVQELQDTINDLRDNIAPAEIEEPSIMMTPQEISQRDVAPIRQDRDIMEMVDNEGVRKSTTYNQPQTPRKQKGTIRKNVDALKSGFINRNVEIDNLSKESGNRNIKFYGDMLNGAMGEVNYDINNAQTNNNGEAVGKSIKQLFQQAKKQGLEAAFNDYLLNYSNIDRHKQGKGSQTPLEVSKRLIRDYSIQYPQFKTWAKDVWQYGKNARQNLVDAGLIEQQTANYLEQIYPHYVPYVSDYENVDKYFEGVGELKPKGLKSAKGGAGALLTVEDALTKYTFAQKNAIRQNQLYKEIVDTLGRVPNFGIDERTDYTNMKDSLFTDSKGNYLTAYENGKQITTQVSADLYKELSRSTENLVKDIESKLSLITTPLQKVSEVRKNLLTTWNPTFPVTNAIKDFQDALFNSKYTPEMIKNIPSALKELATGKGKQVQQFLALYGSGLTMGEYSSDTLSQKTQNVPFLNKIKQINEIVELLPRYAEFKASLQKGATLQEAIYNAREVTTNFNRGGTIAKAMNRNGFTFLNASIQGFDKFIRNFSGENGARGIVQALGKVAALGIVPALFNHLAFDDDDDYEALPDYIKDNYYLIKTDGDNFIRIPKGRMLSIFGSAARRTLETTEGEENAFEGYLKNAWNQIGINDPGENNIFAPLIQAFGSENGNAWYGGDIVPTRLQDKPKGEQYDETTDNFSIWLGDKLNISPKKINYVLDQYLGGIGDVFLPMGTEAASSEANNGLEYLIAPWKDKFSVDSTTDNKYVSDFYSKKEELTVKSNSKDATDEDLLQKKYLDGISKQMSELYAEKRQVQSDSSLSKKEKYAKASEIKREINRLAKEGLDNYQNVSLDGDYAEANGNEYKKDSEGKWNKIKSTETETTSSLGLTSSEKKEYYKTKEKINSIKDTYSNSDVRKPKIIQEIRKSNISDDAKLELYKNSYKDNSVDHYMNMGMNIDNYLDFKSQSFTADKDSSGKSISGSKKQKVFNYINSMDIPFEQKLILAKQEYPNYNEYNREIIEYLNNNQNIDYNEMIIILEDLGFKVEGNNVSW